MKWMYGKQDWKTRERGLENCYLMTNGLAAFSYEDTPIWRFLVNGVEIKKEIGMPQEKNTVALCYEIKNRSSRNVEFVLTPFFQFVPKGADLLPDQDTQEPTIRSVCRQRRENRWFWK